LITAYHQSFLERLRMNDLSESKLNDLHAPSLELLKPPPQTTYGRVTELTLRASDRLVALDKIALTINGVPVQTINLTGQARSAVRELSLQLVNGKNVIRAWA